VSCSFSIHATIRHLGEIGVPTIIVLTKIDKLAAKERQRQRAHIAGMIGADDDQIISFSATSGEGRNELAEAIEGLLAQASWRA
jgi:GTP-binding protein